MKLFVAILTLFWTVNAFANIWVDGKYKPQPDYTTCRDACMEIKKATFMRRQCMDCCRESKTRRDCMPKTTVISVLGSKYVDHRTPIANMYGPAYNVDRSKVYQIYK